METPKYKHYRLAREELALWREEINQSRLDRHVFCQLTGRAYHEVGQTPYALIREERMAFNDASYGFWPLDYGILCLSR